MERTTTWYSPSSAPGSIVSSILVHALVAGSVVFVLGMGFLKPDPMPQTEIDMSYQQLDEPPVQTKTEARVRRAVEPDVKPVQKVVAVNTPKEMQDEKSDVAGTQKAAVVEKKAGSDTNGNADATPYYKIKPKYPKAALLAGMEGWVAMKIDITETGEVENVRVVGGEQRNTFESEARRAVEKWKYRPFLGANGAPIRKADHQVRVDFKLNEANS